LATVPTSRSPPCVNATTDGVVRPPSAFSITLGSPPSSTAMHELVVPRSIPIVFAILLLLLYGYKNLSGSVADLMGSASSGGAVFRGWGGGGPRDRGKPERHFPAIHGGRAGLCGGQVAKIAT